MAKIILVADDDPAIRAILCRLFERESDYDLCEQARNGAEAVEIATRCKPDLIIMDFSMPVMNGLQAARKLKVLMPEVPIVLFTEYDDSVFSHVTALDTFVDRVVSKAEIKQLMNYVRELAPA